MRFARSPAFGSGEDRKRSGSRPSRTATRFCGGRPRAGDNCSANEPLAPAGAVGIRQFDLREVASRDRRPRIGAMRERKTIGLREIRALKPGQRIWDAKVSGFYARRQKGRAVTYGVFYRTAAGRDRWPKIGRHGAWTPSTASAEARRILAEAAAGGDPASDKAEARKSRPLYPNDRTKCCDAPVFSLGPLPDSCSAGKQAFCSARAAI